MAKIMSLTVLICVLSVANAWGAGFMDDFERPDGAVGNGWTIQTDGTIEVRIVGNEVLIAGTQGTDWARCGISRPVRDETMISVDFKADDSFNFHIRIDDAETPAYIDVHFWPGGPVNYASSEDDLDWPGWSEFAGTNMISGEYNTLVLEQEGTEFTVTLNDEVAGTITNTNLPHIGNVLISSDAAAGINGSLHIDNVQIGEIIPGTAADPRPVAGAADVPADVVLSWTPGDNAVARDVYFGTVLAEVEAASVDDPMGALVSPGQAGTAYDPDGLLEFGQTYYWRVDEVNGAPDFSVIQGNIWSFTVEPELYLIQGIVATASHPAAGGSGGPEVTVDGTGLAAGQHSNANDTMWSCLPGEGDAVWIQYDFGRVRKVYGMHIWNYNGLYEMYLGFGFKDVTIEYATEPNEWITLGDYQLDRASGQATYTGQTIDMDGIAARSVRITAHSSQSGAQYGLSEIQFFEKPVIAREPEPSDRATEVSPAASLSWRPGREAVSHQVYVDTDEQAVIDGTAAAETVTESTYDPGPLTLGTDYFWRVDEVNEATVPSVWPGEVWGFTTAEYISIDDFESYTDEDGQRLFDIWLDGYNVTNNGSLVGHENPPYAERTLRTSGQQSMPFYYDNTGGVANSVAELDLNPAQDWAANGADNLSLHYRGVPTGFVMFSDDHILMNGSGADIWGTTDQFRFVYKQLTGNGSIIARVDRLDNTNDWAKAGVMIRDNLDSDSKLVDAVVSGHRRVALQWRSDRGANMGSPDSGSTGVDVITLPYWVKLTRTGDVFTLQHSADGATWVNLVPDVADDPTSITVTMPSTVYIGLAVCSHDAGLVAGAEFSEVATTGTVTGAWQSAAIGGDQPAGNGLDTLYVAVQDSAGGTARIPNPSPTAVGTGVWTQWLIPLSDLTAAGVNTHSIAKFSLGVGDATQPSKNAAGVLYIDDIAFGHPIPTK